MEAGGVFWVRPFLVDSQSRVLDAGERKTDSAGGVRGCSGVWFERQPRDPEVPGVA